MLNNDVIMLEGGTFLRPLRVEDVTENYVEGLNDPVVHKFLTGPRQNQQNHQLVASFVQNNLNDRHAILFGFFTEGALCGTCRLHDIRDGQAIMGIAIFDRSQWGKGWASKIISAVAEHAFSTWKLREIKAGIHKENVGSERAFKKAGFTKAGPKSDNADENHFWWYRSYNKTNPSESLLSERTS